jgi:RNA polymerase sigma-70 factor (ECF subfamily)
MMLNVREIGQDGRRTTEPTPSFGSSPAAPAEDLFSGMAFRHTDLLYRWAVRRGGDPADAWDIVQDAFERALRTRPAVGNDQELRAWLCVVVRHLFVDQHRSAHNRMRAICEVDEGCTPAPKEALPLWRQYDVADVYRLIPLLTPGLRSAYELHVAGHSLAQIADRLAIPQTTVGTRLLRARARLRGWLLAGVASGATGAADEPARWRVCRRRG